MEDGSAARTLPIENRENKSNEDVETAPLIPNKLDEKDVSDADTATKSNITTNGTQDMILDTPQRDDDALKRKYDLLDFFSFFRDDSKPAIDVFPSNAPVDERFALFGVASIAYLWYRSQAAATFDLNPFCLEWNDLWGIFFIVCFLGTHRATYIIYAVNPIRDLVLVTIQWIKPAMALRDYQTELYRDIISSILQLTIGVLVLRNVRKQPMCTGTIWADLIPGYPKIDESTNGRRLMFAIIVLAISTPFIYFVGAEVIGYDLYLADTKLSEVLLKLCLVVPLGMSEEISWREVVLGDTNNCLAALIWGLDHLVAGEGDISNPYLYGVAAVSYAFTMGIIRLYKVPRYFNHASVEFIALQSLI